MKAQKLYDPTKEILEVVSLLIGGTTEQDMHSDNARMFCSFMSEDNDLEVNYEINREAYNTAIMSEHAHSSIISGFDDSCFRLCIPTIYVNIYDDIEMASIKYGKSNEMFPIVKNDILVSENHNGLEIPFVTIKVP